MSWLKNALETNQKIQNLMRMVWIICNTQSQSCRLLGLVLFCTVIFMGGCSTSYDTGLPNGDPGNVIKDASIKWRSINYEEPNQYNVYGGTINNTTFADPHNIYPPNHTAPQGMPPAEDHYLFLEPLMDFWVNIVSPEANTTDGALLSLGIDYNGDSDYDDSETEGLDINNDGDYNDEGEYPPVDFNNDGVYDLEEIPPVYERIDDGEVRTHTELTQLEFNIYKQTQHGLENSLNEYENEPFICFDLGKLEDHLLNYYDNAPTAQALLEELDWHNWRLDVNDPWDTIEDHEIHEKLIDFNVDNFPVVLGDPPYRPIYKAVLEQSPPTSPPPGYQQIECPDGCANTGFGVPFYFVVEDCLFDDGNYIAGYEYMDEQHGDKMTLQVDNNVKPDYSIFLTYKIGNIDLISNRLKGVMRGNTDPDNRIELQGYFLYVDQNNNLQKSEKGTNKYICFDYNDANLKGLPQTLVFSAPWPSDQNVFPLPEKIIVESRVVIASTSINAGADHIYPNNAPNLSFTAYQPGGTPINITINYEQFANNDLYSALDQNAYNNFTHLDKINEMFSTMDYVPEGEQGDIGPVNLNIGSTGNNISLQMINDMITKLKDSTDASVTTYKYDSVTNGNNTSLDLSKEIEQLRWTEQDLQEPGEEKRFLLLAALTWFHPDYLRRPQEDDRFSYWIFAVDKLPPPVGSPNNVSSGRMETIKRLTGDPEHPTDLKFSRIAWVAYDCPSNIPNQRRTDAQLSHTTAHELAHMFGATTHGAGCSYMYQSTINGSYDDDVARCCIMIIDTDVDESIVGIDVKERTTGYIPENWDFYKQQFVLCPLHRKQIWKWIKLTKNL